MYRQPIPLFSVAIVKKINCDILHFTYKGSMIDYIDILHIAEMTPSDISEKLDILGRTSYEG